jgi:hypothetical protein
MENDTAYRLPGRPNQPTPSLKQKIMNRILQQDAWPVRLLRVVRGRIDALGGLIGIRRSAEEHRLSEQCPSRRPKHDFCPAGMDGVTLLRNFCRVRAHLTRPDFCIRRLYRPVDGGKSRPFWRRLY